MIEIYDRGPGWLVSDYESNRIIGQNQADKAIQLFEDVRNHVIVDGPVDYRQKYWDITKTIIRTDDGKLVSPCPPAMVNILGM